MNKFKIGDKVRIKDKTGYTYGICEETLKEMRKLKDIWTIKSIRAGDKISFYTLKEDKSVLFFCEDMLEKVNYTYEDLKKSPIGTKVTFENEKTFFKIANSLLGDGYKYQIVNPSSFNSVLNGKIIKIEEPIYQTVYECKEEILDEAEKRYLRGVIRPFRDKVIYICKTDNSNGKEYINVDLDHDALLLPDFKSNTMYKGMKLEKKYTLEELGL